MNCRLKLWQVAVVGLVLFAETAALSQDSYPLDIRLTGPPGNYSLERWRRDWPGCKFEQGVVAGRVSLVDMSQLRWLRVACRANQWGPENSGASWRRPIPATQRIELAYQVRFSEDFEFVPGGVLPGLAGGAEVRTGVSAPPAKPSFSAHFRWLTDGVGEASIQHLDSTDALGEPLSFSEKIEFPRNQPIMLIMRIGLNEVEQADGTFEAWVKLGSDDAIKVIHRDNLRWRSAESAQIDSFVCDVFHRGGDPSYAPRKDCTIDLADIKLME